MMLIIINGMEEKNNHLTLLLTNLRNETKKL